MDDRAGWRLKVMALTLAIGAGAGAAGQTSVDAAPGAVQTGQISGDPDRPRRHLREANPADLGPDEAEQAYSQLIARMDAGYRVSGDAVAARFRDWPRYNTGPYRFATHGRRFVNNYANETARAYGDFEAAGRLPVGSVIAKDSFTASADGQLRPGPLFLMEKMEIGFNYVTGDWRYTMIMPDGVVFGVTKGENEERVEFCIGCHLSREEFDHLYFVPEAVRARPPKATK